MRLFLVAPFLAAAALLFASPAAAAPCEDGVSDIEYGIAVASGELPAYNDIGSDCSEDCLQPMQGVTERDGGPA